jgi:transposase-like protein
MDITQVYKLFPTQESCLAYIEALRWKGQPICPYCRAMHSTAAPKEQRHHCNGCNTSFSATVGTVFHHTHLDLQKWFLAAWLILNAKRSISARQLGRDLEVNKNTAWRIAMQIRQAMASEQRELLESVVEMAPQDGGKLRRGRGTSRTMSRAPGVR